MKAIILKSEVFVDPESSPWKYNLHFFFFALIYFSKVYAYSSISSAKELPNILKENNFNHASVQIGLTTIHAKKRKES